LTLTDYIEFSRLTQKFFTGQIEALLVEAGACSITVEGADQQVCMDDDHGASGWGVVKLSALFDREVMNAESIKSIESELAKFPLSDSLSHRILPARDWNEEWQKHIQPTLINDCLWIGPTWGKPSAGFQHAVRIDPGLAFGTGSHETTQLCLEALLNLPLENAFVIDFGCGTGILGIVSCVLGARCSVGIDIDPRAIEIARQNSKQNNVEKRFRSCLLQDFLNSSDLQSAKGDIVVANILTGTLIEYSKTLEGLVAGHGTLILSGILVNQAQSVVETYQDAFQFSAVQREDWVALIGTRQKG